MQGGQPNKYGHDDDQIAPHLTGQEVDGREHDIASVYHLIAGSVIGDDPNHSDDH